MHMEMDFPHPRRSSRPRFAQCNFRALTAKAVARQSMSSTVLALLSQKAAAVNVVDSIEARMDLLSGKNSVAAPSGAFFPSDHRPLAKNAMYETPVYRSASENGKDHALDCLNHKAGQPQWGMEA